MDQNKPSPWLNSEACFCLLQLNMVGTVLNQQLNQDQQNQQNILGQDQQNQQNLLNQKQQQGRHLLSFLNGVDNDLNNKVRTACLLMPDMPPKSMHDLMIT